MDKFDFIPSNKEDLKEQDEQVVLVCKTILANMATSIYDGRNIYAKKVGVCQAEDGRLYWGRNNVLFYPTEQVIKKALSAFKEKGYHPYYDNDVCFYRVAKDKSEVKGEYAIRHTCWL